MKKLFCVILVPVLVLGLLSGCGGNPESTKSTVHTAAATANTVNTTAPAPEPVVTGNGDPESLLCKDSYTGEGAAETVVARAGESELTLGQLQAWYWAEAAAWKTSGKTPAPDFSQDLDTQVCELDESLSWQHFFLRRALNAWNTAQGLTILAGDQGLPVEEAFQPNLYNYEKYMTGMPATKYLYRYAAAYSPNSMHQDYLDRIPQLLETAAEDLGYEDAQALAQGAFAAALEDLESYVYQYNWAYMYFTDRSFYMEPEEETVTAWLEEHAGDYPEGQKTVDLRHVLLVPESAAVDQDGKVTASEAAWEACAAQAEELLEPWTNDRYGATESAFADLAYKQSADKGTAPDGGAWRGVEAGQLIAPVEEWAFDGSRQAGDTAVIRSEYGCHLVYFCGGTDTAYARAREDVIQASQEALLQEAVQSCPMEADYSAIALTPAEPVLGAQELLYADVSHERFPEVPLYLQQDYPTTMYGGYKITTNGCGITSMAMLASYMADQELTPPEMCDRFGSYSFHNGTDGSLFQKEPPLMGFFLREKTYDPTVAHKALEEGLIVISIQHKGYWTGGGHYIVLEKLNEDGTVQVRDSNLYNYGRISAHKEDKHTWGSITSAGSGYWIFEPKVTAIPACARCGEPDGLTQSLYSGDYACAKCRAAVLRRTVYLEGGV